jgi:hypothetical protein
VAAISVSAGLSLMAAIVGLWLPGRRSVALLQAPMKA